MTMESELFPCPFCGAPPCEIQPYGPFERDKDGNRIDHGDFIECSNCECRAWFYRANTIGTSDEQRHANLIERWNRRPAQVETRTDGEIAEDLIANIRR